jgi:hypothetical protein
LHDRGGGSGFRRRTTGARTNTIAQGALVTNQGRTQSAITGVLTVNPVLSVTKAFAPATVAAGSIHG